MVIKLTILQFAATMGTGIVSIVLNQFSIFYTSYEHSLRIMSIVFFILNLVLFVAISFVALLRYTLYPGTWILMLRHPVQSLFLGCIPMGFSTLINMFVLVCVPAWGGATIRVAWALWWIDVVASMACCLALPFQMYEAHPSPFPPLLLAIY
jgi:tellurite resistance protein TehA-like permease